MKTSNIRKSLLELDNKFFTPRSMTLKLLKDCPQAIPVLAQWVYEEWHPYDKSLTKEKLINGLGKRLNDHEIPFTLVVLKDQIPVGTISLKEKGEPEFHDIGIGHPWIGSFHVADGERKKKIGSDLLTALKTMAAGLGLKKIFVYTSNPKNVDWYVRRGAQVIGTFPFRGHQATIMELTTVD